jgi:hypothetical protein
MRKRSIAVVAAAAISAFLISGNAVRSDPVEVQSNNLAMMLEALIQQQGVNVVVQNIKASERESGDIDKAIRAVLGISITDIKAYGLLGGPNSEMRKLFKALGLVE